MNIVSVTKQNAAAFSALLPNEIDIDNEKSHTLGAVEEVDGRNSAVGILNFSVTEGSDGDTDITLAVIDWLYVDPRFRRQGAAALLLDELFDILYRVNAADDESSIDGILTDIPLSDEYDSLCDFFETFGFNLGLIDLFVGNFTLNDFTEHPKLKGHKASSMGILPLSEIDPILLPMYTLKAESETGIVHDLSPDADDYEKQLSFVSLNKQGGEEYQELNGVFLVSRDASSGVLKPVYLHGVNSKLCLDLVLTSIAAAVSSKETFPPETPVEIQCVNDSSKVLLANLFPDISPGLSRRMVYDLADEDTTEVNQ
jgi:GNAT superfamily N-acetyltransferase